ncbi:hypothetical protein MJI69_28125, partial [Salmonella enterica subsp. enterica serovar Anatum]|nr:hypothetical protein [Salmonella enterica subsp. enterica serovar Anatum]
DALIGAMFAIISYSSLAAVLLTATLTAAGIISFPVALCLVIGCKLKKLRIFNPCLMAGIFFIPIPHLPPSITLHYFTLRPFDLS